MVNTKKIIAHSAYISRLKLEDTIGREHDQVSFVKEWRKNVSGIKSLLEKVFPF